MITKKIKAKRLFVRYEPSINNGTTFIFNKETGEMLEGDYYCYLVLKCIQKGLDLNDLARNIAEINKQDIDVVEEDILHIVSFIEEKDFVFDE